MKLKLSRKLLLILFFVPLLAMAQKQETQIGDTTYYKSLIPEAKQGLLKNMSMIANMNFAYRSEYIDNEYKQSRFRTEQFRLEFRGQVTDKIYFRFRDRYTRAQTSESIDNLSRSVDLAYVRIDVNKVFNFSAGKMCADWGGFEFDYNPIEIYEYSDIIEYADNFLSGVGASFKAHENHQFTVQVLNSRTKSFTELYGKQPNYYEANAPLAFVGNWRGSLFKGKLKTIWSYSKFVEAENADMNYIALGTELTLGKFVVAYDFKWSDEQLDRTHIISDVVPDSIYSYALAQTQYTGHWVHLHYRVSPKLNVALFGMLDLADWNNSSADVLNTTGEKHIRTAYGYVPVIEFYPWSDYNFKFFANYIGRIYDYSDYAINRFGVKDYTTGRFTIGFASPLGIF